MASKKKKSKDIQKVLHMTWGEAIPILDEDSRFYICKDQKFRKSNPNILEVLIVEEKKEEESEEERGEE